MMHTQLAMRIMRGVRSDRTTEYMFNGGIELWACGPIDGQIDVGLVHSDYQESCGIDFDSIESALGRLWDSIHYTIA